MIKIADFVIQIMWTNVNKYSTTAYPRWVWAGVGEDGDGDGDAVEVSPGPCPIPRGHDPAIDILHS